MSTSRDHQGLSAEASDPQVFISYARVDLAPVLSITRELTRCGCKVLRDADDILPAEQWKQRLQELIVTAEAVVFFITPRSATSEVCAWEIEIAEGLGKRIIPVVLEETRERPPGRVADINYIFADKHADSVALASAISRAVVTDIEWLRTHTRIALRAQRWRDLGRPTGALLRGRELGDAQAWSAKAPKGDYAPRISPLHTEFIEQSLSEADYEQRFTRNAHLRWKTLALIAALVSVWLALRAARYLGVL